jgi:hypothetical protein
MTNSFKILAGKLQGKRLLSSPKHKREDNIKMELRELGCDDVNWVYLAEDSR